MNNRKELTAKLDGDRLELLRGLIANLFVDKYQEASGMISRLPEMGKNHVEPEMLSSELKFEKAVLRALRLAQTKGLPATEGNILDLLSVNESNAKSQLEALIAYRTSTAKVTALSVALSDWIQIQRQVVGLMDAIKAGQTQYMSPVEFYTLVAETMSKVAPSRKQTERLTTEEAWTEWERQRIETANLLRNGKAAGPTFPWDGLRKKVPALKLGWLFTIIAKTGHGKSTIALILAMHWAYEQGYDVYFCHLETGIVDMIDRVVASELLIPADAWDTGKAYIDEEPYKSAFDAKKAEIIALDESMGHIEYEHCPGITIEDFRMKVAEQKVKSDIRGRELIVIVDYYTEFDKTGLGSNEAAQNNAVADLLKSIAETDETNCYMVALAQFDPDTDYDEKSKSWNGGKIYMRSQLYLRMEREMAKGDLKWERDGKPVLDFFGSPISLQKFGDWSSKTTLNVIKCNQGKPGPTTIGIVNGYFKALDPSRKNTPSTS